MSIPCAQERVIGEMNTAIQDVKKQVFGNGKPGFVDTIPRLETKIDVLVETVHAQTKVVSDLVSFQSSVMGVGAYKDKEALSTRQRAAIIVSAIIGLCGIISSIIIKLL